MARMVKSGLIQTANAIEPSVADANYSKADFKVELEKIRQANMEKHYGLTAQAAKQGVQILCYQEVFQMPYFCAEQHVRWYESAETMDGPTITEVRKWAKDLGMVIIASIYEKAMDGVYYNSSAVIDGDGKLIGVTRKMHIPHCHPGFFEKFYFKPGNTNYPVWETGYAKVAPYICYDRHFPDGARILGLHGAEILFNPSATVAGLSKYLWELEQPAHAVANGYYVGAINRVGTEGPWNMGKFYGSSYFCDPKGKIISQGSEDNEELVVADLDLELIEEVRQTWQFYRDRRPDSYQDLARQLP